MNEIPRLTALTRSASGVDDYLQRAQEMYQEQRKRLLDLEAEHERRRTELQSGYARKLSELAHEGGEALRKLEAEHSTALRAERGKLEALTALRGQRDPQRGLLWPVGRSEGD